MNRTKLSIAVSASALILATSAMAEITLYEGEGFRGRSLSSSRSMRNISYQRHTGSVVIDQGAWSVCDEPDYTGQCVVLRQGSYHSRESIGLDRIVSARALRRYQSTYYENEIPPPMTHPDYEYRQRPHERIYEAPVTSVRAIMGPPEQHCWVERHQVYEQGHREGANVGGAIAGALIGGILGHQIGGGHTQDAATAGGAIAGAAIGAHTGHSGDRVYNQDVQRCENVPDTTPDYWEVTYNFHGVEHMVQMTDPPGTTISVNQDGYPRQ